MNWLIEHTFCAAGIHLGKRQKKYDNGLRPLLCRHCYKIVGRWE